MKLGSGSKPCRNALLTRRSQRVDSRPAALTGQADADGAAGTPQLDGVERRRHARGDSRAPPGPALQVCQPLSNVRAAVTSGHATDHGNAVLTQAEVLATHRVAHHRAEALALRVDGTPKRRVDRSSRSPRPHSSGPYASRAPIGSPCQTDPLPTSG